MLQPSTQPTSQAAAISRIPVEITKAEFNKPEVTRSEAARATHFLQGVRESERRALWALLDASVTTGATWLSLALAGSDLASSFWIAAACGAIAVAVLYVGDGYSLAPREEQAVFHAAGFAVIPALVHGLGGEAPVIAIVGILLAWSLCSLGLLGIGRMLGWFFKSAIAARRTYPFCVPEQLAHIEEELRRHPLSGLDITHSLVSADVVVAGPEVLSTPGLSSSIQPEQETVDIPTLFGRLSRRVPVRLLDERWLVERLAWRRGLAYGAITRLLEVTLTLIGLAVSVPFLPVVALAIWLEDRGPIFYSQTRVGLGGSHFRLHKLRTMRVDAEQAGAKWASKNDSRVTRVGNFLRRTRLDEIPQLWNVLAGQMRLVGPRPERPEFVEMIEREVPFYRYRHLVPPGVTGWAQVRYPYGASIQDAEEKLAFDLYYVNHRSVRFDLLIILRTVAVVLGRKGSR